MGYDRRDSFPFDYEPNVIPLGSYSQGKLSLRSYSIQSENNLQSISMHLIALFMETNRIEVPQQSSRSYCVGMCYE